MRELAVRRMRQKARIDDEVWLEIYAEGLAHRYGGRPFKAVLIRDIKGLKGAIDVTDEDIDEAINAAAYAIEANPTKSSWSTWSIGRALGVTRKEREDGLSHLGCFEETREQHTARKKADKRARNATRNRRSGKVSQEKKAPWAKEGKSKRTWFREKAKAKAKAVQSGTEIGADNKKEGISVVLQKQCQTPMDVACPEVGKRPAMKERDGEVAANAIVESTDLRKQGRNLSARSTLGWLLENRICKPKCEEVWT
jgi:hypothetical protein